VVFAASEVVDTLLSIRRLGTIKAENGKPGANKKMHGRRGEDRVIRVPLGTIVRDANTDRILVEMIEPDQEWVAAEGGSGGRGNPNFATPKNRAPRKCTQGRNGRSRQLKLELKLIADVGLVGLPNAGKSTLLGAISAARSKVANYPFTTLSPAPGVVDVGDYHQMVVADLPGLIEGASDGVGLGSDFLKHCERTGVILHLVELVPEDGSDPVQNYRKIRRELERYSARLAGKPELVAGTKLDLSGAEEAAELLCRELGKPLVTFSAATRTNLQELIGQLWSLVKTEREKEAFARARARPRRTPPHLKDSGA
jgi:GTP-binding protein